MVLKNFKDIYKQEYQKLNEQQKKAVDTVEGPVMVIAGPGTGKTQILSRRVANILTNYHTNPEEIVCLTYTEAGASEMLDRLEGLIGEEGRNVRVSTIHSFCSELILENSDLFGEEPKVITAAAKYEILKDIIDEHVTEESPFYKNSGERYSFKEQLLDLFTKMKREDLDKDDFEKEIDKYFEMIDSSEKGDEFYKKFKYSRASNGKKQGDFKPDYDNEQQKMQKLLAGVEIVEKYRDDISNHNYFDFDDMILWTIEKLEEDDAFQRSVSESIKYLFVDEFQDTSVLQNELVDLLVKGKKNPNIFVVGDDDQSIYRFQGVSADNIRDFDKKYRPTKIVLEENYRSSQAIIDASRQLISHNPREDKALVAAGDNKDYDYQLPILKSYPNAKDEMFGVLKEVKELIQSGVSPQEIGVIYGRNSYGEEFAKILRDNGIFVQMKKEEKNLFIDPFFKKTLAILKYICQPSRNVRELRKILYFDFFEVEVSEIVKIRNLKNDGKISIPSIAEIDKKLESIRKKVNKSEKHLSPMYVLSELLKSLSIDEYIMKSTEKYHLVSVLNELYKLMLTECLLHPKLTVKGFLNQLSALQEMRISLPIEELSGSPSNCVQLMTAHGSKGLEFEHVFMMKCNDGKKKIESWPGGENNSGRFSYPPSLNGKDENESQLKEEENRRLFYVAMTRAKKVLHLSYSDDFDKTHFINEFEDFIDEVEVKESFEDCQSVNKVVIPKFSDDVLNEVLGELSLSVSTLNAFLKCPLSFYFNKGLKLPSETNEAMVFGSIIHEVLEKIYIPVDDSQSSELTTKTVLSLEEALKLFETIFEDKSYQLSSDRVKRDAYTRARKIIENLYKKPGYLKDGVIAVEQHIKGIKLGDILNTTGESDISDVELNGKIDKIECEEGVIRLIDYKTGKAKNAKDKLVPPSEKEPFGGDYWRQAVFYYILVTTAGIDISDKEVLVKYVFVEDSINEDGFSETEDIQITQKEVDIVLNQIKESIMKIKQGDFNCGCGLLKKDRDNYPCDYCLQVLANTAPKFDNTEALEIATFQQTRGNYKSLSVSKLNRFLSCPKSVYFDDVLQLSQPAGLSTGTKEKAAKVTTKHAPTGPVFGTAIHETMEQIYKEDLQLEEAIEYYDNSLHSHQEEIIDTMSVEELKEYGHRLLSNLFEHYIPSSLKGEHVYLEKEIRVKLEDKYLINGIIDKLEFDNDLIRVVDYKTGSAQRGVEELADGRDYWRQAVFYNILLENSSEIDTTGKRIETQYIFLDDDDAKEGYSIHTVNVTKKDIDLVLTQIQEFWDKVNVADFTGGCGKDDCDYCRLGEFVDFQLLKENVESQSNKKN